ncbi:MAG: hypothetical protein J6V10_08790 [Clostridia bacterium]|nr:hypothetical protein [Clostridia bacterium]
MNKNFKKYALIWFVLLVAFNAVVFIMRSALSDYGYKYDAQFWIPWVFIMVAFSGNLACAYFAFKAENLKKMFLNLPLITVSWTALIIMIVAGTVLMLIPGCPPWIAAICCIIVLAFHAIAVIKAVWAADAVNSIDEKIKEQTSFIKNMTLDAESILARAKSDTIKTECKKVYEAARFSDPMSNGALSLIEAKITVKMDEFATAVNDDNLDKAKELADEIVLLAGDRNRKCKALK